jgi:hypothetical protein
MDPIFLAFTVTCLAGGILLVVWAGSVRRRLPAERRGTVGYGRLAAGIVLLLLPIAVAVVAVVSWLLEPSSPTK